MERRGLGRDAIVAGVLALVLGAAWTLHGWADLKALRLPDTDDVMRLQQVRDWLAGQRFADLTQHRLGAGLPMHWTRVADLGPAALIALLTPFSGAHGAEVAAVIVWPLLLFAIAVLLVGRIARRVGGPGVATTAAIVAAVAYPATTVFLPGRIDHHGLQMVLLLGATLALLRPVSASGGMIAGLLAAISLVVGLETAPMLAALGLVAVVDWVWSGRRQPLVGLGAGALAGLMFARLVFAPEAWDILACDGFTGEAWRAETALAVAPLALPVVGAWTKRWQARLGTAMVVGALAATLALWLSPGCLHPYGAVDPMLERLWLAHVGEAQPLFAAPVATALGYAGLMLAGLAATVWRLRVTRERGWAVLLVLLIVALAVTLMQLRGAYAGALLAAPGLAAAIAAARDRGIVPLAGAWAASAGMLYPLAADALTPASAPTQRGGSCTSPALIEALAKLPAGTVMAPIDLGAWAIAATRHRLVAAPYHRNGAGNLAMYRFYMRSPVDAARIAANWRVTYIVSCADMPGGAAATVLNRAPLPGWQVAAHLPHGAAIYRLSVSPARH